jgi:exosortase
MTQAVQKIAPAARDAARTGWWLLAAAVLAVWYVPINQLRVEWSINPQYAYGWVVPLLALYLFGERWKDRPAARPGRSRWGHLALAGGIALLLFPARLVEEAAPDWRLVSWALALAVVALSLEAIFFAGGKPWLRHFAFPVCFFLVAVPWPVPFEHALVQQLMRWVASFCVEALSFWGIPAVQQGNVIQISSGVVGVEEACSGVRSLQTTLMIALFLGDLLRFATWRRLVLLAAGLLLAFGCNVVRAFLLVFLFNSKGDQGFNQYHDAIGIAVLVISLAGLGALAYGLRSPRTPAPAASLQTVRAIPRAALVVLLGWIAFAELGTEVWYRIHEPGGSQATAWSIDFPDQQPGYHDIKIPELTQATLRYNQGRAAGWADDGGNHWTMFFLRWLPGRASVQLARSHGPEICLPAAGLTMRSDLGISTWRVGDLTLDAHSYIFDATGRSLFVFFCLAEDRRPGDGPASTFQDMTESRRLDAVFAGRRNRGQQVLEITLTGPADVDEAHDAMARLLAQSLHPVPAAD